MVLVFILLLLQAPTAPPRDGASGVNLRGRVLDSLTGAPIAGAVVEIFTPANETHGAEVETAANGEFQLRNFPLGGRLAVGPPPMQPTHVPVIVVPQFSNDTPDLVVHLEPALVLSGQVVNQYNEPVANVRVVAKPLDAEGSQASDRERFTDDRGAFRLFGLPPGRYRVCAVPYRPQDRATYLDTCHPAAGTIVGAVDVRHRVEIAELTLRLWPARGSMASAAEGGAAAPRLDSGLTVFSGLVVNGRRAPLANAIVELTPEGTDKPMPFDPVPTTDDRGRFRLHGIPPGRYAACASPSTRDRVGAGVYGRGCWPFPVSTRSPEIEGMPIVLERSGAYSIAGRVAGPDGQLPPGISVMLSRVNELSFRSTTLAVNADGSFVASKLPAGVYQIEAPSIQFRVQTPGAQKIWAAKRIEIVDADVTDVVLHLSYGVSVRGRVTFDDPAHDRPLRSIEVKAVPISPGPRPPSGASGQTDDEGSFTLHGVFAASVLRVRMPPQGYVVKSMRYGGRDITDTPTDFAEDLSVTVEVVLTRSTAGLSGRVFDEVGQPAEDAGVLYFPADPARWQAYEGGLRQQSVGGRYRIDGIAGGDYLVIAVRGPRPGWTEKDYAALSPLAERVTLQDGERRILDLRAVTLGR